VDKDLLEKEFSPCKDCPHWYDLIGKCWPNWFMKDRDKMDFECPKQVRRPQQEFAKE